MNDVGIHKLFLETSKYILIYIYEYIYIYDEDFQEPILEVPTTNTWAEMATDICDVCLCVFFVHAICTCIYIYMYN
jgi:hypothetical protein